MAGLIGFSLFMYLFIMFWVFSILGWILEVLYFIVDDKELINRGFLIGPYCPIYGFGAMVMLLISLLSNDVFVIFILSMVLCSTLEYFTSFLMEALFQVRWWDYSNDQFNINGRVCLRNAIGFGALGVLFVKLLLPWYNKLIGVLDYNVSFTICIIILVLTTIDVLVSINAMSKVKSTIEKNLESFKNKDATVDIKKLIKNKIPGVSYLQKRLIKAYHLLDKEKDNFIKTIKKVNKQTKKGYGVFFIFIVIGIISGLILSLWLNLGSYKIVIPLTLSICLLIATLILKIGDK